MRLQLKVRNKARAVEGQQAAEETADRWTPRGEEVNGKEGISIVPAAG